MKIRLLSLTLPILLICLIPQTSHPCTIFCLDKGDQLVVGKNFDWFVGYRIATINKRGVSKTAMTHPNMNDYQPVSWTSKFGSVTFSIVNCETTPEGMNEAGLVVHALLDMSTEYPLPDSRPYIGSGQWVQYQLDNFSTVEQVIENNSKLRIIPTRKPKCHYFVCDRRGNCAIIEFIGGKMVCYTKEKMPVKVLTDESTYAESVAFLKEHVGWGGQLSIQPLTGSVYRFVNAADMVRNYDPKTSKPAVDFAFNVLTKVAQGITFDRIVYDMQNLRVYFNTIEKKNIRYVDLKSFDFSCKTPRKVFYMDDEVTGDVTNKFADYNYQTNRERMEKELNLPKDELDRISRYPESTICTEK